MPRQRHVIGGFLALSLTLLAGCPPPPYIPDVAEPLAPAVAPERAAEITLTEVRFAISPDQFVGRVQEGDGYPIVWKDLAGPLHGDRLRLRFSRDFAAVKASVQKASPEERTVAEAPHRENPPVVVARIVDVRVDIDWKGPRRMLGYDRGMQPIWDLDSYHSLALGKVYMKIAWDLSASAGAKPAATLTSEGGASSDVAIATEDLFGRAFQQATRGFLVAYAAGRAGPPGDDRAGSDGT